jgi:hypothetical protein
MTDQFNVDASTPAQASARLAVLQDNKDWGSKLLTGDASVVAEFKGLTAKIATAVVPDDTHLLSLDRSPPVDTAYGSELFTADKLAFVAGFRSAGLSEPEVAEAMNGNRTYSAEEVAFARNLLNERMADEGWSRRLMNHDVAAYREMKRLSVILSKAA